MYHLKVVATKWTVIFVKLTSNTSEILGGIFKTGREAEQQAVPIQQNTIVLFSRTVSPNLEIDFA